MEERRKSKRLDLEGRLISKRLDIKEGEEVTIEIFDISKTGIGFYSEEPLVIGAVYELFLTLWTKENIHTFFEVVRVELKKDKRLAYGAIFVGMSEVDVGRIESYYTIKKQKRRMKEK